MNYTIGQIFKLGLLKNWEGKPYKDKASVSKVVNSMRYKTVITPFGKSKVINDKQILEHNNKFVN
jgi:hypothetical protein